MTEDKTPTAHKVALDILTGAYDSSIEELRYAVIRRLADIRKMRTISDFGVGDKVRFNESCAFKDLHGAPAVVRGFRGKRVLITLIHPTGRYAKYVDGELTSAELLVPPSTIDLIP